MNDPIDIVAPRRFVRRKIELEPGETEKSLYLEIRAIVDEGNRLAASWDGTAEEGVGINPDQVVDVDAKPRRPWAGDGRPGGLRHHWVQQPHAVWLCYRCKREITSMMALTGYKVDCTP